MLLPAQAEHAGACGEILELASVCYATLIPPDLMLLVVLYDDAAALPCFLHLLRHQRMLLVDRSVCSWHADAALM